MRFTLVYKGDLPPNASSSEKWRIRRALEPQIRRLLSSEPLQTTADESILKTSELNGVHIGQTIGDIEFVSFICENLSLRAEIEIFLMSSELPGGLLHAGDIDNRLKTLFDALSKPSAPQQIPPNPDCEEDNKVFCLLEDDKLITRVVVSNERLLAVDRGSRECLALVHVRPRAFQAIWANVGLGD